MAAEGPKFRFGEQALERFPVQIGTNGDFKMFSAVKWVGNEGAIISTRKITGLRIMRPALWA